MTTPTDILTAAGTFEPYDWQSEYFDEQPGAKLGRMSARKTFRGDIEATSTVQMLTVGVPVAGSDDYQGVAYVAVERITGTVHGRRGSFVVTHSADPANGLTITVVDGSADGELVGLSGELMIDRGSEGGHSYTFDYQLG